MIIASVIVDVPTQALDSAYSYVVPETRKTPDEPSDIGVGSCVVVPLGSRKVIGFVIDLYDIDPRVSKIEVNSHTIAKTLGQAVDQNEPARLFSTRFEKPEIDVMKLKFVRQVVGGPYFDEEAAACALWMSKRYVAPLASCIRLFTPPGGVAHMVKRGSSWQLEKPSVGEVDDRWVLLNPGASSYKPRKNAIRQIQILKALQQGALRVAELTTEFGNVASALKSLEEKGLVRIEHRRRMRGMLGNEPLAPTASAPAPVLTSEQEQAVQAISSIYDAGKSGVVLLDGVTGSGKTEVYLRSIEHVLSRGQTACVLVPEISLTPQTVARFRGRFGDLVAVMHSRMSNGERYDQWDFIQSGVPRVVVGARSALFSPLKNVGIYIIDEEHESTYKQESAPRYHAREVAQWMAARSGAVVVLGSATPSIESLHELRSNKNWTHAVLSERANKKPLPHISVIDMSREFASGSRQMFSRELSAALREELLQGRKAVMLLNQRGFAKFVLCRDCGFVPTCPSCSTSLTFHENTNALMCHHCGYRRRLPPLCPQCESPYLKKFGAGTQRVELELKALIKSFELNFEVPVIRMDADTTSRKGSHQRLLEQFGAAGASVLLGTQMIAKGLDFEDVTLVGVINADTQLYLPDYRAAERTFDLIEQVAGRAGRANYEGRVMVQTYQASHPAIRAAARYDRALFLKDEIPKRRMLQYPPYTKLVNVLLWGPDEEKLKEAALDLHKRLEFHAKDYGRFKWQIFEASPCVLAKLRNMHRWHILIKIPVEEEPYDILNRFFRAEKASRDYNLAVDVDPSNLL